MSATSGHAYLPLRQLDGSQLDTHEAFPVLITVLIDSISQQILLACGPELLLLLLLLQLLLFTICLYRAPSTSDSCCVLREHFRA